MRGAIAAALLVLAAPGAAIAADAGLPRYAHVVVVVEENHGYDRIIGNEHAPWINRLAREGALLTDAHSVEHPSQPNYLDLFSGSNQDVTDDAVPAAGAPFSTANLAAALVAAGMSFAIYSEGLPAPGSTVRSHLGYARKHNPYVNWQPADPARPQPNAVAPAGNLPFYGFFPSDFERLPTVAFVVPDQRHDMHGTGGFFESDRARVAAGDLWLARHIEPYRHWALTHDSLLVVTFDEGSFPQGSHVVTLFAGAHVCPGRYPRRVDHFDVLRTIEDMYGLPPSGAAARGTAITEVFGRGR